MSLTHLERLEAESIRIIREVAAECENPVMLYSIGKDSGVMLHLAMKAFAPGKIPFPLLHVDTTWKFRAMTEFRDKLAADMGLDLIVHTNQEGIAQGVGPFTHGSAVHTDVMKTQALKQALNEHKFDAAFGGARRDEIVGRSLEPGPVGQHRQAGGPAGLVGGGKNSRLEIGADQAFRGRGLLQFGDQPVSFLRGIGKGGCEPANRVGGSSRGLEVGEGGGGAKCGHLVTLAVDDFGEHVGHVRRSPRCL